MPIGTRPITNEADAWREVAERFAQPYEAEGCGRWGLCTMTDHLNDDGVICYEIERMMIERVERHASCSGYYFALKDRDVRVLAALFLELEARDE